MKLKSEMPAGEEKMSKEDNKEIRNNDLSIPRHDNDDNKNKE